MNSKGVKVDKVDDEYCVVGYKGKDENVNIPSTAKIMFQKKIVTAIHESAFERISTIRSVVIPATITKIGYKAFHKCESLTTVTFENGSNLSNLGKCAFMNCGLTHFTVPSSVVEIGGKCFDSCLSLVEVIFADGSNLSKIGPNAFSKSGLKQFIVPKSVVEIASNCFQSCQALAEFTVENDSNITTIGNDIFANTNLKKITVPKRISLSAVASCTSLTNIQFEPGYNIKKIESIGAAFPSIRTFQIPDSVEEIGANCFMNCESLYYVTGGSSLRKIGEKAFENAKELRKFNVAKSVVEIGDRCFYFCRSLSSVTFEKGINLRVLGKTLFSHSKIESIVVPASVEEIDRCCFSNCECLKAVSVELGSRLRVLHSSVFSVSGLTSFTVPKTVEEIGEYCFNCRYLTRLTFEEGSRIRRLGKGLFMGSSITEFVFPRAIPEIYDSFFIGCKNLVSVKFEDGFMPRRIGKSAFSGCESLISFVVPKSVEEIGETAFISCTKLKTFEFEEGSVLKRIGNKALSATRVSSIRIPKSVEELGSVFEDSTTLLDISFEEGLALRNIGPRLCYQCTHLASITIPRSVEVIGADAFKGCRELSRLTFEKDSNLRLIDQGAFGGCPIASLRIPRSVEEIGERCFVCNVELSELTFEEGSKLKKIGSFGFDLYGKGKIETIVIPKSVEHLCAYALANIKAKETIFEEGTNIQKIEMSAITDCVIKLPRNEKDQLMQRISFFRTQPTITVESYDPQPKIVVEKEQEAVIEPALSSFVAVSSVVEVEEEQEAAIEPASSSFAVTPSVVEVEDEQKAVIEPALSDFVVDISVSDCSQIIGSGGFGKVFLYQRGNFFFAAKFIEASNEANQVAFEREVENLRSLSHPFIVGLRGYALPSYKTGNSFVIVMDYIPGGSLQTVIENPPAWFNDTAKARIIYGIASGMAYVHSKGIIHRDLKLSNVLLDERNLPRICDFGSSRMFSLDTTMTSGTFTPCYTAPELYDEAGYTEKVDVYSFGVMLYEIITGTLAFRNLTQLQLMKRIVSGRREEIPSHLYPAARYLIERCWAQAPEDRPSFAEICAMLEANGSWLLPQCDPHFLSYP